MEVLRRQMSENLEKLRRPGTAAGNARALPAIAGRAVEPSLRQSLGRRIGSLDIDDPQFQQRATTLFVESILLAEFGADRANDAGFQMLIRQVATMMADEPEVASELAQLFAELTLR
jgi:hypothetical protein